MRPTTKTMTWVGFALLAVVSLSATAPAQAAPVTFNLCAKTGSLALPDPASPAPATISVPIWGFALDTGGGCGSAIAGVPGPVLVVNSGDVVTVNLTNGLSEPVSIIFTGQASNQVPDRTGAAAGGAKSYSFTASAAGTYLYEAGTNPGIQLPMGLYGAFIVRPAGLPNQAYSNAATVFDQEAVLVLSEIDPNLNAAPGTFDMVNYNPTYWLINGKAYPDTVPIATTVSKAILLRYLNAGSTNHTMMLVGMRERVIAEDAFLLPFPFDIVSETVPSGQTIDVISVSSPIAASVPLYNRQMHLTNGALGTSNGVTPQHFPGGMMTFVSVAAPLYFSTAGNTAVPGVTAPYDDADIYQWDGTAFSRVISASALGLPANANVDALLVVDADTFYMSFSLDVGTAVPVLGTVQDEDVVLYDAGTWTLFFDGSDVALDGAGEDVDAFEILPDGSVVVSTDGAPTVSGPAGLQDEDLLRCAGSFGPTTTCTWSLYFDGSDVGLATTTAEDVDGAAVGRGGNIYLTTLGAFTASGGFSGGGDDVWVCTSATTGPATSCSGFAIYFDGIGNGLSDNLDAIDNP